MSEETVLIIEQIVVVLFITLVVISRILPRIWYRKSLKTEYSKPIVKLLTEREKLEFGMNEMKGKYMNYNIQFLYISPSTYRNFFSSSTLRIIIDFKPMKSKEEQLQLNEKLNQNSDFHFVANCIAKDIDYRNKPPQPSDVRKELNQMISILKKQNLSPISSTDSEEYTGEWDGWISNSKIL